MELPIEIANDHVFVRAAVNGVPADLIVDTGSSVCTLSESFAARAGVAPGTGLATAAGAARMAVRLATARSFTVGGADLGQPLLALVPLDGVSRAEGREVDGTVGCDLFQRYAVEIDYRKQTLIAHDPSSF